MAAPILFPNDPNLQTKTVLADNDVFLIGSPADGNVIRGTTLASIKASIDIPEEFTVEDIPLATTEVDGLMTSEDKTKLDGLDNYEHPATHSLDMITETVALKIMTAEERNKLSSLEVGDGSYIGLFDDIADMFSSDATVGQYCYYELDGYKFPIFCVDEDTTLASSWFAVGGGSVSIAAAPPTITSSPMQVARATVLYQYQIEATNSPINYSVTGLPTGLTCNPYTGLISGYVSSVEGVYSCTAYASNLAGTGSSAFSITVSNTYIVEGLGLDFAFALKKLSGDATYAIEVTNGVGASADIGFDAIGNLDVNALLAHCGAGNGYVSKWYNQGLSKSTLNHMYQPSVAYMPMIVSGGAVVHKAGNIALFDHRYAENNNGCGFAFTEAATALLIIFRYAFENVTNESGVLMNGTTNQGFDAGSKINIFMYDQNIANATIYYDADQIGVANTVTEYDKDTNMHVFGLTTPAIMSIGGVGLTTARVLGYKGYINCVLGSTTLSSEYHYTQIYNELIQ